MDATRLSDAQLFELSANPALDPVIREAAEREMKRRGLNEEERERLQYRRSKREQSVGAYRLRLWWIIPVTVLAVLLLWNLIEWLVTLFEGSGRG
jgi:hypothetical protein